MQRHLRSHGIGEGCGVFVCCGVHVLGSSVDVLIQEELWVGTVEACIVKRRNTFRFYSRVKISLLDKYHFSKATASLLGTLMTSFEIGWASFLREHASNSQFKFQNGARKAKSAKCTHRSLFPGIICVAETSRIRGSTWKPW